MLEVAGAVAVLAVALTFIKDAASDTMKLARSSRRRGTIQVADPRLSRD